MSVAVREPSVTVTVMVEEPIWFKDGDILTRQLGAVPDIVMFPDGIIVVLEDVAVMAEQANAESASVILTATPLRTVSSEVV